MDVHEEKRLQNQHRPEEPDPRYLQEADGDRSLALHLQKQARIKAAHERD